MDIPQFILDKLKQHKAYPLNFPQEYKDFLREYSVYYNWGITDLTTIYKLLKIHTGPLPKCGYDGCSSQSFITKKGVISSGCCWEHAYKNTNINKYGSEHNFSKSHPSRKQQNQNFKTKYGVENPMQYDEFKNNFKTTFKTKYGVENPMQDKDIINKQRIQQKETMLKKYGYEYALQNPTLQSKHTKSCYNKKNYQWLTGEISIVQGAEPIVLNELEQAGYGYKDILTETEDMPEIWYELDGVKHRYFPDFYIPQENLIIEVKSEWTLQQQQLKNDAKFQAVKDAGYNFRLEIR